MMWWRQAVRFVVELGIAYAIATALAFAVMLPMFWFGPWADPPGVDEGHVIAMVVVTIVCLGRAYRRITVVRRRSSDL